MGSFREKMDPIVCFIVAILVVPPSGPVLGSAMVTAHNKDATACFQKSCQELTCTASPPTPPSLEDLICPSTTPSTEYETPTTPLYRESIILLHCGADNITVEIPTDLFKGSAEGEDLRFQGQHSEECHGVRDLNHAGEDVIRLSTPLTGCGTQRNESEFKEVYTNKIENSPTDSVISRLEVVEIPIICVYNRSGRVSEVWYQLTDFMIYEELSETGSYSFDLDLYSDASYQYPVKSFPMVVELDQMLYFSTSIRSSVGGVLDLSIKACRATSSSDYYDSVYYDIIKDWVNMDAPKTGVDCNIDELDTIQVRTHSFRFVELGLDHDMVYIHCDLYVCDPTDESSVCREACDREYSSSSRRRRDVAEDSVPVETKRLTRGPILFQRSSEMRLTLGNADHFAENTVFNRLVLIAVLMAITIMVLLVSLASVIIFRTTETRKQTLVKKTEESVELLEDWNDD